MALNEMGFSIINTPPVDEAFLASFGDLKFDEYSGGNHKYRRFSQYRLYFEEMRWRLELLPHRPYLALSQYNTFAGGMYRHYEPLQIDPSEAVDAAATEIPLDTSVEWQINVHQHRVLAGPNIQGHIVPEGAHQDGHEFVLIAVYRRHHITGAEMSLLPVGGEGKAFYKTTLDEGQMVVLDDMRMFHDVTDIVATNGEGHRDILIVAFSKWKDRWYGDEFESKALENRRQPPGVSLPTSSAYRS